MSTFLFASKYGFFIVFLVAMLLNGIILRIKVQRYISKDPSLERGYIVLILGMIGAYLLPFLSFILAFTVGGYTNLFGILFNRTNPFMLLFYLIAIGEGLIYFVWVWFLGGAEFIAKHPGLSRGSGNYGPKEIKFYAVLFLFAFGLGFVFMYFFQGRLPPISIK